MYGGGEGQAAPSRRRAVARWLWRGASVLVFVLVLDYLVLPQLAGTERSLHLLRSANLSLLVAAVALEAASLVSYSMMTRRMLPGGRAGLGWVLRADITGLGVSHALPGGAATGNAMRFGLLHEGGATATDTAVGLTLEGVLSTSALAVLLWVMLVVSIPFYGPSAAYVTGAVIGALLMAGIALAVVGYSRREALAPGVALRVIGRMPTRWRPWLERTFAAAGGQVRELLGNVPNLRAAGGWAGLNWLFDGASLWCFLAAFGWLAHPVGLLVAYGGAVLIGMLPISPGGLGVVEALLIPALVAMGAPQATAVLGVVSWRLFEYWAPIPLAGVTWVSLRLQVWFGQSRRGAPRHGH